MLPRKQQKLPGKKGQLHITETIAVLFIFFILVVFGIIFYYKYQQVAVKDRQEEFLAMRAMDTTLKAILLPELICSKTEAEPEDNCLDLQKLRAANKVFLENTNEYYFNLFSFSQISVHELYPNNESCVLYNKIRGNWTNREPTYFIVSLRDDIQGKEMGIGAPFYGFGYIAVEVYS